MKKLIIPALFFNLSFSAIAKVEIPRISAPVELVSGEFAEGTLTRLTGAEVAEFLPWAQNAQNQLNRAMKQAQSIPLRDRLPHIERAVRSVVSRSEGRHYQMFMRFALNRGLLLVDELEKNVDMEEIGSQESALDIIQRSIQIALSFYESDLNFQRRAQAGDTATKLSYAGFGASFMQGMYPGVINVLDATAQYRLLYKLVEMVNWDLSRDAEAARYAEHIVEANEMLQDLPQIPLSEDRSNLRLIRRLNSLKIIEVKNQSVTTIQITSGHQSSINQAERRKKHASFTYNSSTRFCYQIDRDGNRLGSLSDIVDIDICTVGYASFAYNSSSRFCYRVDSDGNRLGSRSDIVDTNKCAVGVDSFDYNSSSRYCYKVDRHGNRLGSMGEILDTNECKAGVESFSYNSTTRYCYNVDHKGNRLGSMSDILDTSTCRTSYDTFQYNSSTRYCYAVDKNGNRLGTLSDIVDSSYCR